MLRVSIACLALPFACGFTIGYFIAESMAIFSTVITMPALRYYLPRAALSRSGIGVEDAAGGAGRRSGG